MPSVPEADLEHVLAHTQGLWEPLRGQNIFVTGGTGFFGRWLLESFAYANVRHDLRAHATVLTRDPDAVRRKEPRLANHPAITFVHGDITSFTQSQILSQLPPGHNGCFPFMVHAATEASAKLNDENPLRMIDTVVAGTRNALDFALQCGTRRFLFTSSGAVYGAQPSSLTHVPEDYVGGPDCTNPRSAYGEAKRLAELLCACYAPRGLEPIIARGFAFVGPLLPLDLHFAVGNFLHDALKGGPIHIAGDGTPHRSYLYAADLAIWLWHLLFRGQPNRPYNLGSADSISIADLATQVAASSGDSVEVHIAHKPAPGAAISRYVPMTSRANDELGLKTWISLPEALQRTFSWLRQSPTIPTPCIPTC